MNDERANGLMREAMTFRYSRRQIVQRAAAFGISGAALTAILAACVPGEEPEPAAPAAPAATPTPADPAAAATPTPADPAAAATPTPAPPAAAARVVVWWPKGFFPEEDAALQALVAEWEAETGNTVELSLFTGGDLRTKILSGVEAGRPPDLGWVSDRDLGPLLAWQGHLADVTDIVEPIKDLYSEAAQKGARLFNNVTGTESYYVVPFQQQTIHIHYWRPLLEEAGMPEDEIPDDWDGFWGFWQEAQHALRAGNRNVFGLGFPMSTGATDTYYTLQQLFEVYRVRFVDEEGNFVFDDAVREGIARIKEWYTSFYRDGYVPPGAVNWLDPDNNANFLNQTVVMTPNPTLSIPVSQRANEDLYLNQMATRPWPSAPDGNPFPFMVSIMNAAVFEAGEQKEAAKELVRYLIEPERVASYIKGSLGRWFPVMPHLVEEDPFWADTDDPHISVAVPQFLGETRTFESTLHPAYNLVLGENVWGTALGQIVVANVSPEDATNQAIARIEQIIAGWQ